MRPPLRALSPLLALVAACAAPRPPAPARVSLVPCAAAPSGEESGVVGRRVVFAGDSVVVAGEARGAFTLGGQAHRCPVEPAVVVLGFDAAGGSRFAWCVASPAPYPALAAVAGGFVVAGRITRDAGAVRPVPVGGSSAGAIPATGPEELAILRFDAGGAPRGRTTVAHGGGVIAAIAPFPSGALLAEGSLAHLPPAPLGAEHFLVRVGPDGAVTDLEPRKVGPLGTTPVALAPRAEGGVFRAFAESFSVDVQIVQESGARDVRASIPVTGTLVDLAVAPGADDDLWLTWATRQGRGDPPAYQRFLGRAGRNRNVNERALGHPALEAHVEAVLPLAPDRAAVLWQVAKKAKQPARFGQLALPAERPSATALLVAYEVPGTDEVALAALGDEVMALGGVARTDAIGDAHLAVTGWTRGAVRAWGSAPGPAAPCGAFVGALRVAGPGAMGR